MDKYLRETLKYESGILTGTSHSSNLTIIVELCPWEAGRAIAIANELLMTMTGVNMIPGEINCSTPEPFQVFFPSHDSPSYEGVTFFPNPTKDILTIRSAEPIMRLDLMSLTGETLSFSIQQELEYNVSMSHLPAGIYVIRVHTGFGTSVHRVILL